MNYIGSKRRLSSFLFHTIQGYVGDIQDCIFCDLFAGTGIVGQTFKTKVKKVISNDLEYYSYVLNRNYIGNHSPINYQPLLEELNALKPQKGFIYHHYTLEGGSGRNYFSAQNAQRIDAIRQYIQRFEKEPDTFFFLLASLLESADKVANTASIYGAFLKHLKKSAQKPLLLEPALFEINNQIDEVYNEDSNQLIERISGDILYLDPPYNGRQYGANYHLLNTIALYDHFTPQGKTGMRNYQRSLYCKRKKVRPTFEELIKKAQFPYIFLSYNNEGLMQAKEVKEIMQKYGTYDLITTSHKRFIADKVNTTTSKTTEYLHILHKKY